MPSGPPRRTPCLRSRTGLVTLRATSHIRPNSFVVTKRTTASISSRTVRTVSSCGPSPIMARVIDSCMFCGEVPCSCPEAAKPKKSSPRKKKSATSSPPTSSSSTSEIEPSSTPSSPASDTATVSGPAKADLFAAMKASHERTQPSQSDIGRTAGYSELRSVQDQISGSEPELVRTREIGKDRDLSGGNNDPLTGEEAYALAVLEPLLSDEEQSRLSKSLGHFYSPAQRWRIRNTSHEH